MVEGETRTYSAGKLAGRIRTLEERERRTEEERELDVLAAAQTELYRPLSLLPAKQRQWLSLWELCNSQRYGQGMTHGSLVHSEIWNNLEKLGYGGREKERAFHAVLTADRAFREHAEKKEGET